MKRRSTRLFRDQDIPEHLIEKMIDAAVNGASGGNLQPLSIILVRSTEGRRKLAKLVGNQPWVKYAPLSMIFCLDFSRIKRWARMCQSEFCGERAFAQFLIGYADVMIAAQTIAVLAEGFGIGSVFVGTIQHEIDEARRAFDIPQLVLPMMVLTMGYAKRSTHKVPKLRREAILHREKYRISDNEGVQRAFDEKYGDMDEVTDKYLENTYAPFLAYEGSEAFLEQVKKETAKLEIRNNAQFLFKFQYPSHAMSRMNHQLLQSFRNAGFEMFSSDHPNATVLGDEMKGGGEADRMRLFPETEMDVM
jgi:FMN reductase [NAD(P)H]